MFSYGLVAVLCRTIFDPGGMTAANHSWGLLFLIDAFVHQCAIKIENPIVSINIGEIHEVDFAWFLSGPFIFSDKYGSK
jgi:hypothetical protein